MLRFHDLPDEILESVFCNWCDETTMGRFYVARNGDNINEHLTWLWFGHPYASNYNKPISNAGLVSYAHWLRKQNRFLTCLFVECERLGRFFAEYQFTPSAARDYGDFTVLVPSLPHVTHLHLDVNWLTARMMLHYSFPSLTSLTLINDYNMINRDNFSSFAEYLIPLTSLRVVIGKLDIPQDAVTYSHRSCMIIQDLIVFCCGMHNIDVFQLYIYQDESLQHKCAKDAQRTLARLANRTTDMKEWMGGYATIRSVRDSTVRVMEMVPIFLRETERMPSATAQFCV